MASETVKSEAQLLLHQLTRFHDASKALTRLFEGDWEQDARRRAVFLQLLHWQNSLASSCLKDVLADFETSDENGDIELRSDMELRVLGKPAVLFAASIYDEDLAMLIWSGFIQFHARYPAFDLTRQVLDNSADSLGYSALHYAIEAQMETFLQAVCKELKPETTMSVVGHVVTQDVTLPVNTAVNMGKTIASGGCSLLHLAAKKGELKMVKWFVESPMCMDPMTLRDWDGSSAARVAATHGHDEVAAFLEGITGEATLSTSEVEELRSKREVIARDRYLAHLEPQESMLEPYVFSNIWSLDETDLVRSEVNHAAAKHGWCKKRHASYQTTDMPCHQVARIDSWVRSTLTWRLFPQIMERYQLPASQQLRFRDLFFVKYEACEGERSDLALHRDGSVLSFNMLLNSADEFTGGGTHFDATKRTVHITQGEVTVHSGKVLHAGAPVLSGVRQILVGFLDITDWAF
uniref:Fe2OG dioxygenase domain-containing protein n=1 Tax=Peronospora matthiolae TaxID=2874970 RepID=A0AAV1T721_9STRA